MAAEDAQSAQTTSDSAAQTEQPTQTEETSDTQTAAPTPALNREQRRAQAKGKKSGTTSVNPAPGHFNNRANPNSRGGGAPVEKRLPRTGHK